MSESLMDSRYMVLFAVRNCETFGKTEGYSIPLLRPSDAARIAERHGAMDGHEIVRELRDSGWVKLDPQGRLRLGRVPDEAMAMVFAVSVDRERQCLAEREVAARHFRSLFT